MPESLMLVQFADDNGTVRAGAVEDDGRTVRALTIDGGVYALATRAAAYGGSIADLVQDFSGYDVYSYADLEKGGRIHTPIVHPDPARCLLTGTGLTHTASAAGRDAMHAATAAGRETDSMRIYRIGEAGGKPRADAIGALPEWFYKGDGRSLCHPGAALPRPTYAEDAGEEAEIAGIYVIGPDGTPARVGFALANECSDHMLERKNYLYLAHSKLRYASIGPEIRVGELPADFAGEVRILRDDQAIWTKEYRSGESNMCHSIANLEHHHFKYPQFRRPGDLHVHFLGAACVSFADDVRIENGDVVEIHADPFHHTLRNTIRSETGIESRVEVRLL
jgi:hypothetical protein